MQGLHLQTDGYKEARAGVHLPILPHRDELEERNIYLAFAAFVSVLHYSQNVNKDTKSRMCKVWKHDSIIHV